MTHLSGSALYFPAISLPRESSIASAVLYWDKLYSVVPYSHVNRPDELLSPFMQELSIECGVHHIVPYLYLHEIPDFSSRFVHFLERLANDNGRALHTLKTVRIHAEKLLDIPRYLVDKKLATQVEGEWFRVNSVVADYFMAYLALTLGSLKSINAVPFTTSYHLAKLCGSLEEKSDLVHSQIWHQKILSAVLPEVDIDGLSLSRLMTFKRENSRQIRELKGEVDQLMQKVMAQESELQREEALRDYLSGFRARVASFEREAARHDIVMAPTAIVPAAGAGLSLLGSLDGNSYAATGAALSFLALVTDAVRSIERARRVSRSYGGAVVFVAGVRREFCARTALQ